ncbi:MAG TPA: prepilin-type N-terminal cleavage/methylation domain-containing protein [Verrucomicrobiae bacterium]|nr:prepilin-type N-terminal cleavage/methylation domain-containing protein [Verrucomicrobiae bacterium]
MRFEKTRFEAFKARGRMSSCAHGQAAVSGSTWRGRASGFTLAEVLISLVLIGISLGGILNVYIQSATRADISAHSVSAQMSALSGLEQVRAAKYDPRGSPATDQLVSSNFPQRVYVLDVGTSIGPVTYATNTTTIRTISTNPPLKMIQVDCTWFYPRRGLYTNSVYTYRAANQ